MPHLLLATLDDEPGVLNRVVSLIRRRAFNIQALTVGVDITTLMPRALTVRITSSIALVAAGSRLAVGSSRNRISGSLASARASARRCCSPPDSLRAGRSARASSPTSASNSSVRPRCSARETPAALRA